ncbi:hypothetical protein ABZ568_06165 [Streptomyces olindensis]|uniref:Uncharacterized protein n=1 Tax=Streptomyces olindensis TaxID=358823 RepID=A0ABV2XPV0_9ACTN
MARKRDAWAGSAVAGAAAMVTAGLGLVTNYASVSVPGWAADPWVVWPVFALLLVGAVGLLWWGRRHLDSREPATARLTPVDRLAGSWHGSLRRLHVEGVRGRDIELALLTGMLHRPQEELAVICGA